MILRLSRLTYKHARRIVVSVIGVSIVLMGIGMIVLPGPGLLTILLGLAILATEFVWARRLLKRLKQTAGFDRSPRPNTSTVTPAPSVASSSDSGKPAD